MQDNVVLIIIDEDNEGTGRYVLIDVRPSKKDP